MNNNGLRSFFIMWQGQLISIIGSGLSGFALGVWVFQKTGSTVSFGIVILMANLPAILIKPLAGFWADRFDRRRIIMLSDFGAGLGIAFITLMLWVNHRELWPLYLGLAWCSLFSGLKLPAYEAAISQLTPKAFYGQASGMVQASLSAQYLISPILAGLLVGSFGIKVVVALDVLTFLYAIGATLLVKIPLPEQSVKGYPAQGKLGSELINGLKYFKDRTGLLLLALMICASNFLYGFFIVLIGPMVLSFSTPQVLGIGESVSALGMLLSSLWMAILGPPRKMVRGIFLFLLISGISYSAIGLRANITAIVTACFVFLATLPVINTCVTTVFRQKVSQDMQGRIFSLNEMFTQTGLIISYLFAGPIVEKIFKPLSTGENPVAEWIGKLIGAGPGREIGWLFIVTGSLTAGIAIVGYLSPKLRLLESELADVGNHPEKVQVI